MSGAYQHPAGWGAGPAPLLPCEPAAGPDGQPAPRGHTKVLHTCKSGWYIQIFISLFGHIFMSRYLFEGTVHLVTSYWNSFRDCSEPLLFHEL